MKTAITLDPDMNQAVKLLVQSAVHAGPEPHGSRKTPEMTTPNRSLRLGVQGDHFYLDGKPFDMWSIRTASATKDTAHGVRRRAFQEQTP